MNDAQWIVIIDYYCRICRAAISTHRNSTATTRDALGSNPGGSIRNVFVSFFQPKQKGQSSQTLWIRHWTRGTDRYGGGGGCLVKREIWSSWWLFACRARPVCLGHLAVLLAYITVGSVRVRMR